MKRVTTLALAVLGLAVSGAYAQRGGSRGGGFSVSHGGVGFHGSYAPSTKFSYAPIAAPRVSSFGGAVAMQRGYPRGVAVGMGGRRGYGGGYGHPRGFNGPYSQIVVPWVPGPGWVDGDALAPGYDPNDVPEQAGDVPPDASIGLAPDAPMQEQAPAPVYRAENEPPANPARARGPEPEDAVTLIFKDGRPPLQIHNYMLSRTTLYVRDQHKQDIPVADLDLVATEKVNRDAGVDFKLPGVTP